MESATIAVSFRFARKGRTDEQIQSLLDEAASQIEDAFGTDGIGVELETEVDKVSAEVTGDDSEADLGQVFSGAW